MGYRDTLGQYTLCSWIVSWADKLWNASSWSNLEIDLERLGWRQKVVHTWILVLDVVHLRRYFFNSTWLRCIVGDLKGKTVKLQKERRALCLFDFQARQSRFYFPILIQEMYPAGGGQCNLIIKRMRDPQMYIFILYTVNIGQNLFFFQESTISSGSSTTETRWAKRLKSPASSSRSRSSNTLRTQQA